MVQIVATDQQADLLRSVTGDCEIVDSEGRRLGHISTAPAGRSELFTDDEIAAARRAAASDQPRRTTRQVLDRLSRLED